MYSKHELSIINEAFWTTLGRYLAPILSADGEKINWINYKTGEKNIRFVMNAANSRASIIIEFSHKDTGLQKEYFDKLFQLKKIFDQIVGDDWQWHLLIREEHSKIVSRVFTEKIGVNILDRSDWPSLITFFKQHIIALDKFWSENKFAFER